jgi:hypothetical protein
VDAATENPASCDRVFLRKHEPGVRLLRALRL